MTAGDRAHWDRQWASLKPAPANQVGPPPVFEEIADLFPTGGTAIEFGCGRGRCAVWLAERGMHVTGIDISAVAIDLATEHAQATGQAASCEFIVADLDDGVPIVARVDLVMAHFFRDPRLDAAFVELLKPNGLLALASMSEVDVGPGDFRMPTGHLGASFAHLHVVAQGERDGVAWILARRTPPRGLGA